MGFVLAAIAIWTGLLCLTAAGIHENIHEYSALAHRAFQRNGERVVDVAIIVLTFGSQLGYILVVGTTLSTLFKSWGCDISLCNDANITLLSVSVFVTPVCMFRHFGHLAYLSLFSVATIVAVILLVMIGGPIKHQLDHVAGNYEVFNAYGMLASLGSIVFSLDCASSNFQAFISTEETAQSLPSWREVTRNAVVCGAAMCMIMGLVGYLSFGADTDGDILDNFPQAGFDVFKVMVVIHLILYIPSNFVIMRYSIVKLFSGKRSEHLPSRTHTVLTVVLLAATVLMVIALLQLHLSSGLAFSLILNITGGIGGKCCLLFACAQLLLNGGCCVGVVYRIDGGVHPPVRHLPEAHARRQSSLPPRPVSTVRWNRCHGRRRGHDDRHRYLAPGCPSVPCSPAPLSAVLTVRSPCSPIVTVL